MDDQFNGRTDDDLFADDFEPVPAPQRPAVAPAVNTPSQPAEPAAPTTAVVKDQTPKSIEPVKDAIASAPKGPKDGLSQSRHAAPAKQQQQQQQPSRNRKTSPKGARNNKQKKAPEPRPSPAPPAADPTVAPRNTDKSASTDADAAVPPPSTAAATPAKATPQKGGANIAAVDRLGSGQNPRTKLSDKELADKMERMRVAAAERTRKFEQAENDSRSHAAAYEKGMEELRKKRAEEAERRKRGEEERKRMDDERERNRERKMRAMSAKNPGANWDEGKDARTADEEAQERRRAFRGAHGGVRGTRGMGGSRFSEREGSDNSSKELFDADDSRGGAGRGRGGGRGRGERGAGRGGRGGRGGAQNGSRSDNPQKPPSADEFPALPGGDKPATKPAPVEKAQLDKKDFPSLSKPELDSPPVGRWDEEVEYEEAAAAAKASTKS